jgi:porin
LPRYNTLFASMAVVGVVCVAPLPGSTARAEETRETEDGTREDGVHLDPAAGVSASAGAMGDAGAAPPATPRPERTTLTGDWGGLRTQLHDSGFNVRADYVSETFAIAQGGLRRGDGYSQQVRGGFDVDLGKTLGWSGALFHVTVNDRAGVGVSSEIVGNRLPIQEDAGGNFAKLTEFTIEQNLAGGRLNLRLGYFAMGNDLGGMALGCNLVNAAFCAHPLSFSGDTGWYNYPNARWGLAVRFRPRADVAIRTGIYQVNPNLSLEQNGFRPFAGGSTGFLVPLELEYDPSARPGSGMLPGHYKLGIYYDTTTVARQGASGTVTGRYGAYVLADQMVVRTGASGQGLSLFGQLAANPRDSATITRWYAAGLVQTGTFRGRDADTISLGIIQARVNPRLRMIHQEALDASALTGSYVDLPGGETAIEFNYGIQVRRYLNIRPDVQYILDPGAFSFRRTPNALALGGQVRMQF